MQTPPLHHKNKTKTTTFKQLKKRGMETHNESTFITFNDTYGLYYI